MHECSPRCPIVRRQLREQIKKAGWTDEYTRSIIGAHSVDTTQDLGRGLGHKVKPDPRKKPLGHRKRVRQELAIDHDDRYERERRRDHFEPTVPNIERVIDYEESTDDSDEIEDEFEKPVASLTQESIYYTEKKQIARVAPLRKVTPKVSPQSIRGAPSKTSRTRTPKVRSKQIGSPIEDKEIIVYGSGEVEDTAVAYRKELNHKVPVHEIPDRKIADREVTDYGVAPQDVAYRETPDRKVLDHKIIDHEIPGPSRIVDDKRTVKSRDDSPDSYYKYTPKELSRDWPHDDCDETCPASILKERAEKLQNDPKQMNYRHSPITRGYFQDICTCSLPCMVHHLRKDPFVRSILTSAMLFTIGIKLCSELHGWYLPILA